MGKPHRESADQTTGKKCHIWKILGGSEKRHLVIIGKDSFGKNGKKW